jgi:restriction system protein
MARYYQWSAVVSNDYLGASRVIKGSTEAEVNLKAADQVRRWSLQEARARERDRIADLKERADFETSGAARNLAAYRTILSITLSVDDRLNWESLKDRASFPDFEFGAPEPTLEDAASTVGVSLDPGFLNRIGLGAKKRSDLIDKATALLKERKHAWESQRAEAQLAHSKQRSEFEAAQAERNAAIDSLKSEFEESHADAIEKYVHIVLERSRYPEDFEKDYEVTYDPIGETLIVSYELPPKDRIPRIASYRFVASRKAVEPVEMKQKEFDAFYEDALYQICLRTLHEVFESVQ